MSYIRTIRLIALLAMFTSQPTLASDAKLVIGKARNVCMQALAAARRKLKDPDHFSVALLSANIRWETKSFNVLNGRNEPVHRIASVASFDIDNDGQTETIWKESTSLWGESADYLTVFEGDNHPNPDDAVPADDTDWVGIRSFGNSPYERYGFTMGHLFLVSYAGRNYVLMEDVLFGRERRGVILVAEYRGRPKIDKDYSSLNNTETDDINVVCKIVQTN